MLTASIYLFYSFTSLVVCLSLKKSRKLKDSVLKALFQKAFGWIGLGTAVFALVIFLFQGNLNMLGYGMIAGRIPLLIGTIYLAAFGYSLYTFKKPPEELFLVGMLAVTCFAILHASIWLGNPTVANGVIAWNVPNANKLTLFGFFLASFVFSGFLLLRDSIKGSAGSRTSSLMLSIGLLMVGLGAAMISDESIKVALLFQISTAIGGALIVSGVKRSTKSLSVI